MRLLRHLFAPSAQRWLPADGMARITQAIDAGEARHSGEICFAVEPALHWRHVLRGTDVRARAEQAFARLRVWDTEANTGVLLYVLLAEHRIEIVADRGIAKVVAPAEWEAITTHMDFAKFLKGRGGGGRWETGAAQPANVSPISHRTRTHQNRC